MTLPTSGETPYTINIPISLAPTVIDLLVHIRVGLRTSVKQYSGGNST